MFSSVNFVHFFFNSKCVIFPKKSIMFDNVVLKGLRFLFNFYLGGLWDKVLRYYFSEHFFIFLCDYFFRYFILFLNSELFMCFCGLGWMADWLNHVKYLCLCRYISLLCSYLWSFVVYFAKFHVILWFFIIYQMLFPFFYRITHVGWLGLCKIFGIKAT